MNLKISVDYEKLCEIEKERVIQRLEKEKTISSIIDRSTTQSIWMMIYITGAVASLFSYFIYEKVLGCSTIPALIITYFMTALLFVAFFNIKVYRLRRQYDQCIEQLRNTPSEMLLETMQKLQELPYTKEIINREHCWIFSASEIIDYQKKGIFLDFDRKMHILTFDVDGRIETLEYIPGRFISKEVRTDITEVLLELNEDGLKILQPFIQK